MKGIVKIFLFVLFFTQCGPVQMQELDSNRIMGAIVQLLPFLFPDPTYSSSKSLKSYQLGNGSSGIITGRKVEINVPFSTDISSQTASFYHTGILATVGSVIQVSGETTNNYSTSLEFSITAEDKSKEIYSIITQKGTASSNSFLGFQFDSEGSRAVIQGTNIIVYVPNGVDVTNSISTFSHNGSSVYVDGVEQISGQTSNNFSTPVVYEVRAEDGSIKQYTVTVNPGLPDSKQLISFSLENSQALISGTNVYVVLPFGMDVTKSAAVFGHSGKKVTVNKKLQVNGETENDFTSPVVYSIHAADDSVLDYTVIVDFLTPASISTTNYTVSGTLVGLSTGNSVTLQNNATNNLTLSANGAFSFTTALNNGSSYNVTFASQPIGQTCSVANPSGTSITNIGNIIVSCSDNPPSTYTVSGTLVGLGASNSVTLQNNATNNLTLSANGTFTFSTALSNGSSYLVSVFTQPSNQTCSITYGSGTSSSNVNNIQVSCDPNMESKTGYVDNNNGTVYDPNTGLTWMKCSQGQIYSGGTCSGTAGNYQYCSVNDNSCNSTGTGNPPWTLDGTGTSSAYNTCNSLNTNPFGGYAGKTGWRVPNKFELETLLDLTYTSGATINQIIFPSTPLTGWTSAAYANIAFAWGADFSFGVMGIANKTDNYPIRCVRSGI